MNQTQGNVIRIYISKLAFRGLRGSREWSHEGTERALLINFCDLLGQILEFKSLEDAKSEILDRSFIIVLEAIYKMKSEPELAQKVSIEDVLALDIFNGFWMKSYDVEAVALDFSKLFDK